MPCQRTARLNAARPGALRALVLVLLVTAGAFAAPSDVKALSDAKDRELKPVRARERGSTIPAVPNASGCISRLFDHWAVRARPKR